MELIGVIITLSIPCTLLYFIVYKAVKKAILKAHEMIQEQKSDDI